MRTVAVVTSGRSDWSLLRPIVRRIDREKDCQTRLLVTGSHLAPAFGHTIDAILEDGFQVAERIPCDLAADTPNAVAGAAGRAFLGFADTYHRQRPDLLLVLGDRYETHAAASAAPFFRLPVAHVHGGESSEGAIDELFRHSITKLSHLHFAATKHYAQRILQMGEEPWRVHVSGAPGLDCIREGALPSRTTLEERFGLDLATPPLLVTFHPVTLEHELALEQLESLLGALERLKHPSVLTYPSADTGGQRLIPRINAFAEEHPWARVVPSFGGDFHGMMALSAAMVGNSSSGIIEAASFKLPVVDVGTRQRGRDRPRNVISCGYDSEELLSAVQRALTPAFRAGLTDLENPYGDGCAADRIVSVLRDVAIDARLLMKAFHDRPANGVACTPPS